MILDTKISKELRLRNYRYLRTFLGARRFEPLMFRSTVLLGVSGFLYGFLHSSGRSLRETVWGVPHLARIPRHLRFTIQSRIMPINGIIPSERPIRNDSIEKVGNILVVGSSEGVTGSSLGVTLGVGSSMGATVSL